MLISSCEESYVNYFTPTLSASWRFMTSQALKMYLSTYNFVLQVVS